MDYRTILAEQKQIIAAFIAGMFAIIAAYIRKDKGLEQTRIKRPVTRLLLVPIMYLVLGASLLAVEFFAVNVKPDVDLGFGNPGSLLCLAGCVFLVASVVWLPINFIRLIFWRAPVKPTPSVKSSTSVNIPNPSSSAAKAP